MNFRYRIGIDVGGTNTDVVIMKGRNVLASVKRLTTADITSGVRDALLQVLQLSQIHSLQISRVTIGTTIFTNSIIERKHLMPTSVIRICLPATASIPPMSDWPKDIRGIIGDACYLIKGGYEFDGREISPLDEDAVVRIALILKEKRIFSVVVNSVFNTVNDSMEKRVSAIIQYYYPNCNVVQASQISGIGLIERENAAILNASMIQLSHKTVDAFTQALRECSLDCRLFITKNDGTLMNADFARRFPILTVASGPTNSMRGAAFLSNCQEAIVVDIGGTTTDVGILHNGFPRQAATTINIGGVRTNFRMPDILSVGFGGGSVVHTSRDSLTIGPDSIGYRITELSRVFGGEVLTASDIAVALGRASFGRTEAVFFMGKDFLFYAAALMDRIIIDVVDKIRFSSASLPIIVVGGGSVLLGKHIDGLEIIRPDNYSVANAVGAAISQISGEIDKIYNLEKLNREQAIVNAITAATTKAVLAGARKETITIVEQEDTPLSYMPGNTTRIRLKVVGDLDL